MAMRGWVKVLVIMVLLPILIGGIALAFAGRSLAFQILQDRTAHKFPEVQWIGTGELARWLDDSTRPRPVVLDARTEAEFGVSHLKTAVQIDPYKPSLKSLAQVPKDTPLVVYSSAGYRGARVASWLGKQGYGKARNLAGGVFLWVNQGRPIFREENRPAALVHPYDRRWGLLVEKNYRAPAAEIVERSAAP